MVDEEAEWVDTEKPRKRRRLTPTTNNSTLSSPEHKQHKDVIVPAKNEPEAANRTPVRGKPTKVLHLNANGSFGTPKKGTATDQRSVQGLRPDEIGYHETISAEPVQQSRRRGRPKRSLIAILVYRNIDQSRQAEITKKIDEILDSKAPLAQVFSKGPSIVKAENTSKSTHPFFMGKEKLKSNAKSVEPNKVVNFDESENRKSFTTPGKMKFQASMSRLQSPKSFPQPLFEPLNSSFPKKSRLQGLPEPWPWRSYLHVGSESRDETASNGCNIPTRHIKAKQIGLDLNDVSCLMKDSLAMLSDENARALRLPTRVISTGLKARQHLANNLNGSPDHPALINRFQQLDSSASSFDKGDCETIAWSQKYAPKKSSDVLQKSKEMATLKEWLQSLTIASVEGALKDNKKVATKCDSERQKSKGKRRKRPADLDDFMVSDDEDGTDMQMMTEDELALDSNEITQSKQSVIRIGSQNSNEATKSKNWNTFLLSGPHGCGKTAAAYAVAAELGFEVFEINPSNKRSGKDILDRVGDMTRNHLVRRDKRALNVGEPKLMDSLDKPVQEQKSVLNSFFGQVDKNKKAEQKRSDMSDEVGTSKAQAQSQKQSIILLEEVDVLFESDKQFWEVVLNLAVQSRRPILLTCNNESLLPLDTLSLQGILRFNPTPVDIAADYLLLVAAQEGHLLDRNATTSLYNSKGQDLRASLTTLNFWCQMAIGDEKGGLEWYLPHWPPGIDRDPSGRLLRVFSQGTYTKESDSAAFVMNEDHSSNQTRLLEAWTELNLDPAKLAHHTLNAWLDNQIHSIEDDPRKKLKVLQDYDHHIGLLSATDVFCRVDLPHKETVSTVFNSSSQVLLLIIFQLSDVLDTTQPPISDLDRSSFVAAFPMLQADILKDYEQLDTAMAVFMHENIIHLYQSDDLLKDSSPDSYSSHNKVNRATFSRAFDPISDGIPADVASTHALGLTLSSFDRTFAIVVEDLAPYVRSIAAFDIALEQQRLRLSGNDGGAAKRKRTTRASRTAVEGGLRSNTRRARWFTKDLNYDVVLATANPNWPQPDALGFWADQVESAISDTGSVVSSQRA